MTFLMILVISLCEAIKCQTQYNKKVEKEIIMALALTKRKPIHHL